MGPEDREGQHADDLDSIYRTPESQTAFTAKGDLLLTYVGPKNADYYRRQFDRFRSGSGSVSWNWPAFFLASFWFPFRKMWLYTVGYWIGLPVAFGALNLLLVLTLGPQIASRVYFICYALIFFLLVPMFANWLYFQHARSKVEKVTSVMSSPDQQSIEIARIGGTSNIVLVLVPFMLVTVIGILAAIAIPAYQDYTIRAQVSEGLNLAGGARAAVTHYYQEKGAFPEDNRAAGMPFENRISGQYVAGIDIERGEITISYGKEAHQAITGQTLVLTPEVQPGGVLSWNCHSPSLQPKYLPSACR